MRMLIDRCPLSGRQLHLGWVRASVQPCHTPKALRRASGPDKLQHPLVTDQRLSGPVRTNQVEHAMLNRIPFRRAGREVGQRDREIEGVGQLLQSGRRAPTSITIRAATIGLDQHLPSGWVASSSLGQPPATDSRTGKCWGFMGDADHNISPIVGQIVNAIRNGFTDSLAGKVMVAHRKRVAPPGPTRILEAPNQLLLFRIDATDGVGGLLKGAALLVNVAKLALPIRIVRAGDRLAIALEGLVAFP